MEKYDVFAKFYDQVMGDRSRDSVTIQNLIQEQLPTAKTVLELACGTGSILKPLSQKYDVSGLDLSQRMLDVAAQKVPKAKLYHQSMVDFKIEQKFDVILCIFDSINHLLDFEDWKKLFDSARDHLNKNGLFIFDINTLEKLQRVVSDPAWVQSFDGNIMIMDVTDKGNDISNWNIKMFRPKDHNLYELHEEDIQEVAFPVSRIDDELKNIFKEVTVKEKFRRSPTSPVESYYFICRN